MSAIIEIRNADGTVGRCDAKCYAATIGRCRCVCGGANHGAGRTKAVANARKLARAWKTKRVEVLLDPQCDQEVFPWILTQQK